MTTPRDRKGDSREIIRPSAAKRVGSELQFHIEMRTRELIDRGMSPDDARREAIRRFGNIGELASNLERIDSQTDGIMRRARFLREALHDAHAALRLLTRRRGFAALAIGTLALGIGAATAMYSVVDGVLLRPLPFDEPGRIAAVWITQPSLAKDPAISWLANGTPMGSSEYLTLLRDAKSFSGLALYGSGTVTLTTSTGSERVAILSATSSLLPVLRVHPVLGRGFVPSENVLNGVNVAMVSFESWRSRFGSDSSVIGRRLALDGKPYEIIGVLPPGTRINRSADAPEFWLPALRDSFDLPARKNRGYKALGRLAPGVTYSEATQEVARLLRSAGDTMISGRVEEWQHDQTNAARGPLLVLLGAAGLLLLIACVNVAILQLGEGSARANELATRAALGAGSGRLVRQLLVESIVISFASAVIGAALAWFMIRGLVALAPARLPGLDTVSLDARVLLFTMVCAAATGLVFGIMPAMLAGRAGSSGMVRSGLGASGRGARHVQRTLIAVQLALSMVLLVEAALLSQSLRNLSGVRPGFRAAQLSAVKVSLPDGYDREQRRLFTTNVLRRLAGVPGVEGVTASTHVPFVSSGTSSPVQVDRAADGISAEARHTQQRYVVPGFFETLGMRLVAGRFFTTEDRATSEPVAIVSAAEVIRDFGGQSPLGRQVKHQGVWRRVVGVVADVKYRDLAKEDEATIYVPFDQLPDEWPLFVVRGAPGVDVKAAMTSILHDVEPGANVAAVFAVPAVIAKSYAAERYRTVLVLAFGIMAALLSAIGLYGVSVRTARRRRREMGIRLAIGATSAGVLRLLVSDAMKGVAIGLVIGTPGALLAGRIVSPYLFRISPNDPVVFGSVAIALVIATAAASAIPARRAGRLNVVSVLRTE